jgi:four helix bundle protein
MTRDYKKIVAWQLAHELTLGVYQATRRFLSEERFGITSQLRRAAFSTPSNTAEGSGRDGKRDFLRFLYIALASLKETEYFLLLARDLQLLGEDEYKQLTNLVNRTFATLQGLMRAIKKQTGPLGRMIALIASSAAIYAAHRFAT